jgi:mannose-6-phosphate isomerase-like protein (cupin superfamily)
VSQNVVIRGPGEGRAMLVGGADYIIYKVRSDETDRAFFCFEASTNPGFGPPLHRHSYRELFYVLEGEYEFTLEQEDGDTRTVLGRAGTAVAVAPNIAHTFRDVGESQGRLLFVHAPAALEEFFEEFGVPVSRAGEADGQEPPDFGAMAAALERNGVTVLGAPGGVR